MISITEMLEGTADSGELLEQLFGLNRLDRTVYEVLLLADGPRRIDDLAVEVDRDRTSVYRSLTRLRADGFVTRSERSLDSGGYYHVFEAVSPAIVAEKMRQRLNELYATIGPTVAEFKDTYGPGPTQRPAL